MIALPLSLHCVKRRLNYWCLHYWVLNYWCLHYWCLHYWCLNYWCLHYWVLKNYECLNPWFLNYWFQTVFDEMKSMMSAWANGMALKGDPLRPLAPCCDLRVAGTSCYGVRTYQRDSYLHLHVDTVNTHVISGIINVNQSVGSAWPLEILDHDGKLHSVTMEPGDLVFYESARLLHGRPHPLDGDSYANVFVHYMPERAWDVRI